MMAGKLDRRVTIDQAVDVQDATTGAVTTSWVVLATVWARIQPKRGRENFADGGILAEMDTLITIRALRGVTIGAKHRIRHTVDGVETIYNVVIPAETELAHEQMELACKSGRNEG